MIRQRRGGGGKTDATRGAAAEPGPDDTTDPDPAPVPVPAPAPAPTMRGARADGARADGAQPRADGGSPRRIPSQWIFFAVASGACAAINGAFAKLTTTGLTSTLAHNLVALFAISSPSAKNVVEFTVRGIFFALNLVFNGIMWTLFTTALAKGTSTTQVSIMNTSTNFVLTALLGFVIFSEALPPLWWAGAALLVAGNVVIGTKVESAAADDDDDALTDHDMHPGRRERQSRAPAPVASSERAAEAGEWKPLLQSGGPSGETSYANSFDHDAYANSVDQDAPHLGDLSSDPVT